MKRTRLRWLLALMGVLIVVRLLVPNAPPPTTVLAVVRPMAQAPAAAQLAPTPMSEPAPEPWSARDDEVPGNAFATPPAPPAAAPPRPLVNPFAAALAAPLAPAPPVPPSFQVIGTWDDVSAPGVFVATPFGTVLARKGTLLAGGYLVTAIGAQRLTLEQQGSKAEFRLDVPRASGRTP